MTTPTQLHKAYHASDPAPAPPAEYQPMRPRDWFHVAVIAGLVLISMIVAAW